VAVLDPQGRKGQAEMIVEIGFGFENGERRPEESGRELLRRRFAYASGNADDGDRPGCQDRSGEVGPSRFRQ